MSFHEHCSGDGLLVLRQSQLYCHDGLSKCQHFVDTHIDVGQFQQSFQFLIYFQSYEAMQTCASMRRRVKWNIGRISILDLDILKALSTCHRL